MRTGRNTTQTHLLVEATPPIRGVPRSWVRFLRRHQSFFTTGTVFLIVLSVVLVRYNIGVLSEIADIPLGNFTGAASLDSLDTSQIVESSQTLGLVARINRPIASNPVIPEFSRSAPVPALTEDEATGIRSYVVVPGDSVWAIANRLGLQPTTIQWANPKLETNAHLSIGEELLIPPVDGALHRISPGENLIAIAGQYKVEIADIVNHEFNGLETAGTPLRVGQQLMIPGGVKPPPAPAAVIQYTSPGQSQGGVRRSGIFLPALEQGIITQGYWSGHRAIDYSARMGAPIRAADHGVVAHASFGWNYGYGNVVVVDHGEGFSTLYAHLEVISVKEGDVVQQGQQLGTLGNTGNSTGPHLHLELRINEVPQNPLAWIQAN